MIDHAKVRKVIRELLYRHNLSYEQFGESLGVSKVMISSVLNGKRKLSEKKVEKLCKVWGVELENLHGEPQVYPDIADIMSDLMIIKQIDVNKLSELTGMSVYRLSQIKRGLIKPCKEEIKKIAEALEVNIKVIDEGIITSAFHIIKEQLERLGLSDEAIEAFMIDLEREIQNRRYY